jgi:predicted amidophosphoribosyltransferase|tara:strand:+ start:621 stop:803 length:183 start_codon:yes stop_codon:yes gene_type:complete
MPLPHQCVECDKPVMKPGLCSRCEEKINYDPEYQPKNCFTMMTGKKDNVSLKLYHFGKDK